MILTNFALIITMQCISSDEPADLVPRCVFCLTHKQYSDANDDVENVDNDDDKFYDDNVDYLNVRLNDSKLILPNLPFSWVHLGHR